MWKRKISIKEQYGTLEHFLKGDEPCHYIGQRYIEGTNFYARREWRGVRDTAFAFLDPLIDHHGSGKICRQPAVFPKRLCYAYSEPAAGSARPSGLTLQLHLTTLCPST